ncbi:FKBP-type peptidyl-prolyl cis-trans isomerase SlyD [Burkholderiales bacterium]|nr:FKBP-type peptidyl-prolyl cis-trans isomerase SlyD [Burkholderiales bacterium]
MQVAANTVVTLTFELYRADGELIERSEEPVSYLHGGYDGIFPKVEQELTAKAAGDRCSVGLDPEDAFGDYDSELVRVEPVERFPGEVSVGMQFEAALGKDPTDTVIFTVTDIAEGKVVVDGNHPLAGERLRFDCTITEVRPATSEEISHGHVHGAHGHH